MSAWADELISVLRGSGWPEPGLRGPISVAWMRPDAHIIIGEIGVGIETTDPAHALERLRGDVIGLRGPPQAIAKILQHWRWIADP